MLQSTSFIVAASLATFALGKTDLSGCTSTDVSSPAGASIAYYVPGTGELCEFLDCGGGRGPPKTTVPGCPSYEGTETYSPSFLAGYGSATPAPSEMATAASTTAESEAESSSISESMAVSTDSSGTASESAVITTDSSMSTITSVAVAPTAGNGTIINSTSPSNGTMTSRLPTATPASDSGAMGIAHAWAGGAGLVGLGALVMAL